jgi:hypothetical protein
MEVALEWRICRVQWRLTYPLGRVFLNFSLNDLNSLFDGTPEATTCVVNWLDCSPERHLNVVMATVDPRAIAQPLSS